MTKEEVLSLDLTPMQKERVESFFQSYERFNWTSEKDKFAKCSTKEQVLDVLALLQINYNKRKEQEQKKQAKEKQRIDKENKLLELISKAESLGFTIDDIINIVNSAIKEKHNKKINDEIAALKAKLI